MGEPPRTILVIEDDAGVATFLTDYLRGEGHAVVACRRPDLALGELRCGLRPALLLIDFVLAGEATGLDVLAEVRRLGVDAPAVLITGAVNRLPLPLRLATLGVEQVLAKPFDIVDLDDVVARLGPSVGASE